MNGVVGLNGIVHKIRLIGSSTVESTRPPTCVNFITPGGHSKCMSVKRGNSPHVKDQASREHGLQRRSYATKAMPVEPGSHHDRHRLRARRDFPVRDNHSQSNDVDFAAFASFGTGQLAHEVPVLYLQHHHPSLWLAFGKPGRKRRAQSYEKNNPRINITTIVEAKA